jgi:MFS transporter, OPA family, glycerol-3-phosphate transporter
MAGSVAATLLFGASHTLVAFVAAWGLNRYAQAAGWGAMVQIASRWFPASSHARVLGVLSMSYLVGDAVARIYLGSVLGWGYGWRGMYVVAAATLAVLAVGCAALLRSSPRALGLQEPPEMRTSQADSRFDAPGLAARLGPLLRNPMLWAICLLSAGMTLLRDVFSIWSPTYLADAAGLTPQEAARSSAVFPLLGALSALLAGTVSDRWRGQRAPIIVAALGGLTVVLTILAALPVSSRPGLTLGLLASAAFLLTGPYTLCAGVMALDLGGKRAGATAAGLIDAAGYIGALASGAGVGMIGQRAGWGTVIAVLAGVAGLTTLAAVAYWIGFERRPTHAEARTT